MDLSPGDMVLHLVARYEFPPDVKGRLDHLIAELSGHPVFATSQGSHAVVVFDSQTHKVIRTIEGITIPHGLLYRDDVNRLYVTDGSPGALKIYDGRNYNLIKSVELLPDTDPIAYDPTTRYLYIVNGGRDAKLAHSLISIVDTVILIQIINCRIISQCWSQWKKALILVTPETVVRWHQAGFRLYWRLISKVKKPIGRRQTPKQVRQLIFRMVAENTTWGAPRIHGELPCSASTSRSGRSPFG